MSSCSNEKDDIDLIHSWRDGDEFAFVELLGRYKKKVRAVARCFFLVGADKEDLLQEGMIGFYKAILSFDESKQIKFSTFAELCIERQIMSAVKMAARKKHSPLNDYVSTSTEDGFSEDENCLDAENGYTGVLYTAVVDPEKIFLERESEFLLKKEISSRLSSFENTVFELFISGLSYKEMSESTGRSEKTIDNAIQRIKRKLRDIKEFLI